MSLLSDEWLARRAAKGDERALAAIFRRYHQPLYRFSLAIVGNSQDAQDALQNTMVKVLRALPGEQRQIELKPWLYRIAHNESVELLRRRRPTEELDPELSAGVAGLAESAEVRERLRHLIADLDQLPERQRGALVMRELSGLDYTEIGTALGASPAVARQTLYEARLSLRQMDAGREMRCSDVTRALSDADGRVTRRRDIRAHLRACQDCRRFHEELVGRRGDLAALSPLPAVAAAGILQGLVGSSGATGAGLAGTVGGGAAAKSLGAATVVKSAATVAVVAAVGVGAADRSGVVDVTPWGSGAPPAQGVPSTGAGSDATAPSSGSAGADAAGGEGRPPTVEPAAVAKADARPADGDAADSGASADAAAPRTSTAAEPGPSTTHPHGRGHGKQHPSAAAHGQQTAAGHKSGGKGVRSGKGRPESPPKPPKPTKQPKPAQPGAAAGGRSSPQKAPTEPGSAAQPQAKSVPRQTKPTEPPPLPESGEGP